MCKDDYKQRYRTKFPTLTNPSVYNETIPNNATNVVWSEDKYVHKAKTEDYLLFVAAKCKTYDFILVVVDDILFRNSREHVMFYSAV